MATLLGLKNSILKKGVEVYKKDEFLFVVAPSSMADEVFVGKDDIEGSDYLESKGYLFVPLYFVDLENKLDNLNHYGLSKSHMVEV